MAGRGRGRGSAGGLKGATWDYDPTLKLDAKPTDLYPKASASDCDRKLASKTFQEASRANASWSTLHTVK
ncbi:hypothetical protein EV44_g3321 [Erysiphe necator]|uniref:Uncharacterized protein n=1 Tax=Uncinula necator TaxID=52586 RepID=A0A0B1P4X7_UNCNE|nr:hypothetical protein EV44_g3321 [Erysiphe necator]